jgi:hypothetical protein
MRALFVMSALTLIATALAGCAGDFRIKQTEPFRIQIDGEPKETRVAAGGSGQAAETSEFKIESNKEVEKVTVVVEVTKVEGSSSQGSTSATTSASGNETGNTSSSAEPAIILVIVKDNDNGEKLAEKRVEADEQSAQVSLDIDVKGRNNVVIVTQAVQGIADVSVAAEGGTQVGSAPSGTSTTHASSGSPTPSTSY